MDHTSLLSLSQTHLSEETKRNYEITGSFSFWRPIKAWAFLGWRAANNSVLVNTFLGIVMQGSTNPPCRNLSFCVSDMRVVPTERISHRSCRHFTLWLISAPLGRGRRWRQNVQSEHPDLHPQFLTFHRSWNKITRTATAWGLIFRKEDNPAFVFQLSYIIWQVSGNWLNARDAHMTF